MVAFFRPSTTGIASARASPHVPTFRESELSGQAREIATFRKYIGYEWPNALQEPDTFDCGWELLANTADLKVYLFTVRSGDPHELIFNINGTVSAVDPIELFHWYGEEKASLLLKAELTLRRFPAIYLFLKKHGS